MTLCPLLEADAPYSAAQSSERPFAISIEVGIRHWVQDARISLIWGSAWPCELGMASVLLARDDVAVEVEAQQQHALTLKLGPPPANT